MESRLLLAVDFGDAPPYYATLLDEDGARHTATGPTLGSTRDSETNGIHSANADADGADEDGVIFGAVRVGQLDATATINVQGGSAKLDAWIDLNRDGSWGGPGEQIADSLPMVVGDNSLSFDVPSWAISGLSFARFRLSTTGDLGIGGSAADGEIEDYAVIILPPVQSAGFFGSATSFGNELQFVNSIAVADVDGDGDLDAVTASNSTFCVSWHENDGAGNFIAQHAISNIDGSAKDAFAIDVDGDSDMDVLAALRTGAQVLWFENDGSQSFTTHLIANSMSGVNSVIGADLDADGDVDVLSASSGKIAWFENDGDNNFVSHLISTSFNFDNVNVADIDADGDLDVLSASSNSQRVDWYENTGNQSFIAHVVRTGISPESVFPADMDGDGDMDILTGQIATDGVRWYENDGNQTFIERIIDTPQRSFQAIAADLNGDSDLDIVTARGHGSTGYYLNDGNEIFSEHTVDFNGFCVAVGDINGDGRLDILSGNGDVVYYKNESVDFGDSPAPYRTTLAEGGPAHWNVGPTLGATRDSEFNGAHAPNADADGSDEDGVTFGTIRVGQLGATATINVQGSSAMLDAWIDFNGDGSWGGPYEHIAEGIAVVVGDNLLSFDVPPSTPSGVTFARFRLSTAGNLGHSGLATDGEVEDYILSIAPPNISIGFVSDAKLIGTAGQLVLSSQAVDIDRDGDMDVLSALQGGNDLVWYENDGHQQFAAHSVSTVTSGVFSVFAVDLDGDGDVDLLSGLNDGQIAWYENDGYQNFTTHQVADNGHGALDLSAADVDGDGDIDILSAVFTGFFESMAGWYENNGNQVFTHRPIGATDGTTSIQAADVDSDGDLDFLTWSLFGGDLVWHENDGLQNYSSHSIDYLNSPRNASVVDLDADGDMDIVMGESNQHWIAWYDNDGSETFTLRTILTSGDVRTVTVADFDGDGDLDLLSSGDQVSWFDNDGSQIFTEQIISSSPDGFQAVPTDLDSDGDLDALYFSFANDVGILAWNENGVPNSSTVAGRFLFYNQSAFDGSSAAQNASDDNAIAIDKSAYLPNATTANFNNVTSFTRGINGIMVDLAGGGDHASINANDFVFKVGNDNAPSGWSAVTATVTVSVRLGEGTLGSDRVTITWASGSISNKWLEVQVLPTANTGLTATDVFFWGNKVGDTGQATPAGTFLTSGVDKSSVLGATGAAGGVTSIRDFNRDNTVSGVDASVAIGSLGSILRINIGAGGPFAPDGDGGDSGVASALAATSTSASAAALPAVAARRLENVDLNSGRVAAYFQHLADQNTAGTRKLLVKIDAVADELSLDDELLDSILAELDLDYAVAISIGA